MTTRTAMLRTSAGIAVLLFMPGVVLGQGWAPVAYAPSQFQCARFIESSRSAIETETGGRKSDGAAGRDGVLVLRGGESAGGVSIEAWYDSLDVWRATGPTTVHADTDGLIGGRYRGMLSPEGEYLSRALPFVPDEVAEVAEMGGALDDLFPRLPPRALRTGETWRGPAHLAIQRLADSALSGVPLFRFRLTDHREGGDAKLRGDTTTVDVQETIDEDSRFVWHPGLGMIRLERHLVSETTVPSGGRIPRPVRSRIDQRIALTRDPASAVPDSTCR